MRVLIIEAHSDGLLDLCLRAKAHGHTVKYFLKDFDPIKVPVGRGLVDRVPDWRPWVQWSDLVILGSNGYCMNEFDAWQKRGIPIIGAGSEACTWEHDRHAGMQAFKRAGIPIVPYTQVSNLNEAIDYVAKRDTGIAIKPAGTDVTDKSLSCVCKSAREAVWRLSRWKKEGKKFPSGIILQDLIKGIEFAVGAWISPEGFVEGWEENFEEKKLFAGGIGPNVGEAGTVMRLVKRSKLAEQVLQPLEDKLVSMGYVGNVDVNCIVDEAGIAWPLEHTVRLGYPAVCIELSLHRGDPIEFLAGVAAGKAPKTRALDEVAVGVVMALPPYPFGHEKPDEVVGVPIWGVTAGIEDALHPAMVQVADGPHVAEGGISKRPVLATAGSYVLVATGCGSSVVEARQGAYRVLDRLTVPASPFWRVDIGSRLRGELPKLQAHGYAKGLTYA